MSDRRPSLLVYIAETSKAADLLQLLERMHADRERYARGIYAPGEFAFPIIEQPKNNDLYVSSGHGVVTDYHLAEQNGTTGLLAHNLLAGALFYNLEVGQQVWVVEGEHKMRAYQVTEIQQFQRVEKDEKVSYVNLSTEKSMTIQEVFDRFYTGRPHLTLQTCLEEDGDPSWGLTFIVAEPVQ